jgi:hypothetical protein
MDTPPLDPTTPTDWTALTAYVDARAAGTDSLTVALRDLRATLATLDQQLAALTAPPAPPRPTAGAVPTLHLGDTVWVRVYTRDTWTPTWRLGRLTALEQTTAAGETLGYRVEAVALHSPFVAYVTSLEPADHPDAFSVWAFGADVRPDAIVMPTDEALDAQHAWEHLS